MNATPEINEREKLEINSADSLEIIAGYDPRFLVIEDKITGKSRWADCHRVVIQRVSDGKFFADGYRSASTECQDERPWEFEKFGRVPKMQVKVLLPHQFAVRE